MKKVLLTLSAFAAFAAFAINAQAVILINEIFVNPPGTDDTQEFIEFRSTTGGVESLSGLHLLVIEGDTTSAGLLDGVLNLGSFSTGANGLFVWAANAAINSFSPAPAAASTLNISDFSPDIENGAQTYLLVTGYTGAAIGTDLDTDNNEANGFSGTAWTSVVDAIGVHDSGTDDHTYGSAVGFADFPVAPSGFDPEVALRLANGDWIVSDIAGTNPGGPYTFDGLETIDANGDPVNVTALDFDDVSPGNVNPIPEPATAAFALMGLAGFMLRRRRA